MSSWAAERRINEIMSDHSGNVYILTKYLMTLRVQFNSKHASVPFFRVLFPSALTIHVAQHSSRTSGHRVKKKMALVTAGHHSFRKTTGIEISVQAGTLLFHDMDSGDTNPDVFDAPAPVIDYMTTIPAGTFDETALVTEYLVPAPCLSCAAPAPVIKHVAPASDVNNAAPTPDLTNVAPMPPTTVTEYIAPSGLSGTNRCRRDDTEHRQFSTCAGTGESRRNSRGTSQ